MIQLRILLIVAVLATAIMWSCDADNPVEPELISTPGIMPLAVGNYWVYEDSIWANDSLVKAITDSVAVDSISVDNIGKWFFLSSSIAGYWPTNVLMVRGDTVFTRAIGYCIPFDNLSYCGAMPEFVPPVDTPFTHHFVIEGDISAYRVVEKKTEPRNYPAGTFDEFILYHGHYLYIDSTLFIITPNLGMVYAEMYNDSTRYEPKIERRRWLLRYRIQ